MVLSGVEGDENYVGLCKDYMGLCKGYIGLEGIYRAIMWTNKVIRIVWGYVGGKKGYIAIIRTTEPD